MSVGLGRIGRRAKREAKHALLLLGPVSSVTAAFVALALSLATALYTIWPDLKPDPGELLAASVSVATIEPRVTLGEYLDRSHRQLPGADSEDRKTPGSLVYVRIAVHGRKHKPIRLSETLYDARTKALIPGQSDTGVADLRVDTPNDKWIEPVFAYNPYPHPVFARISVYDHDVILAFIDTRTLAAAR